MTITPEQLKQLAQPPMELPLRSEENYGDHGGKITNICDPLSRDVAEIQCGSAELEYLIAASNAAPELARRVMELEAKLATIQERIAGAIIDCRDVPEPGTKFHDGGPNIGISRALEAVHRVFQRAIQCAT